MSIYAIGDIQGCFKQFMHLLEYIQFNEAEDQLWFTGDLVNRGPNSLLVLRAIKQLNGAAVAVLGNHDLHLLACYYHRHFINLKKDTFIDVLTAPDADILCDWLRRQPLLHYHPYLNFLLVHAGIAPHWTLAKVRALAQEVEIILQSDKAPNLLLHLYGNKPCQWSEKLKEYDRWRCIINYLTRIRFCDQRGRLNLKYKGSIEGAELNDIPWFNIPWRKTQKQRIIFGHWAALNGKTATMNTYGLDTGCIWGGKLTALRLEDLKYFQVDC